MENTERPLSDIDQVFTDTRSRFSFPGLKVALLLTIASLVLYFCSQLSLKNNPYMLITKKDNNRKKFVFTYKCNQGDTFERILTKGKIAHQSIPHYLASLESIGLSSALENDSIIIKKQETENTTICSILNNRSYWYHLFHRDSILHVEKRPFADTKYQYVAKGKITHSLEESFNALDLGSELVEKVTNIFLPRFNIKQVAKKNDVFEIIFEKCFNKGEFVGYGDILAAKFINRKRSISAIGMVNQYGEIKYYTAKGKCLQKKFLKTPVQYHRMTSGFSRSRKHPIHGFYRPHLALDLAAPIGTPVYSVADGIVTFAGVKNEWGNHVRIRHDVLCQTQYGHLQKIRPGIKEGAYVRRGQLIGTVGITGVTTGPHLCFRMKVGDKYIEPFSVMHTANEYVKKENLNKFNHLKSKYLNIFEERFNQDGCFIVDIAQDQSKQVVLSKTILLSKDKYDHIPNS